ncbi:MAG TPA: isocitrate lyase/phosphoenolpyruvate mutase family protein [Terriglobales bacterium]|jgi:2-methylisocitrate lyase-like PEP mutase family enzyme|nr:isocitrate lyase/phosphoenolpyruvate mutase family protein [Terriglobales bacterium]
MNPARQKSLADALRKLHHGPNILVLANCWDVASARVLEAEGVPAIATSSAGVAFSLGYPDGQRISRDEMLTVVARVAKAVQVPVTADVESGYGARPEDAARTAAAVIAAGAVGMNLEDSTEASDTALMDVALAVEKIRAVREAGSNAGVPLVINARTDVYLNQVGAPESRYDHALRRAVAFRDAGADCIFLPGVKEPELISRFVRDVKFPINILAGPGFPAIAELQRLGVARVSLGSKPMLAGLGVLRRLAQELRQRGTYTSLEGVVTYAEMQKLLE